MLGLVALSGAPLSSLGSASFAANVSETARASDAAALRADMLVSRADSLQASSLEAVGVAFSAEQISTATLYEISSHGAITLNNVSDTFRAVDAVNTAITYEGLSVASAGLVDTNTSSSAMRSSLTQPFSVSDTVTPASAFSVARFERIDAYHSQSLSASLGAAVFDQATARDTTFVGPSAYLGLVTAAVSTADSFAPSGFTDAFVFTDMAFRDLFRPSIRISSELTDQAGLFNAQQTQYTANGIYADSARFSHTQVAPLGVNRTVSEQGRLSHTQQVNAVMASAVSEALRALDRPNASFLLPVFSDNTVSLADILPSPPIRSNRSVSETVRASDALVCNVIANATTTATVRASHTQVVISAAVVQLTERATVRDLPVGNAIYPVARDESAQVAESVDRTVFATRAVSEAVIGSHDQVIVLLNMAYIDDGLRVQDNYIARAAFVTTAQEGIRAVGEMIGGNFSRVNVQDVFRAAADCIGKNAWAPADTNISANWGPETTNVDASWSPETTSVDAKWKPTTTLN